MLWGYDMGVLELESFSFLLHVPRYAHATRSMGTSDSFKLDALPTSSLWATATLSRM